MQESQIVTFCNTTPKAHGYNKNKWRQKRHTQIKNNYIILISVTNCKESSLEAGKLYKHNFQRTKNFNHTYQLHKCVCFEILFWSQCLREGAIFLLSDFFFNVLSHLKKSNNLREIFLSNLNKIRLIIYIIYSHVLKET